MARNACRRLAAQHGQALLEFAFIMPFVIIMLFAMIDFGLALDRRITLQHAVREGARFAAVHANIDDVKARTVEQSQGLIDAADVDVCYVDGSDANSAPGNAGDLVRVTIAFTWHPRLFEGMLGAIGGGSALAIEMSPSASARLERAVGGAMPCAS